jgi:hypothetical protein
VIDIEAMIASQCRSSSAGMMPSQSVRTSRHSSPISSQSALAMSMSKPTTEPSGAVSEKGG